MKKRTAFLVLAVTAFMFMGCGKGETTAKSVALDSDKAELAKETGTDAQKIDIDLTEMSGTMVFSEVYNMMENPEDYEGKIVKMSGQFAVYQDEDTGKYYYAALIADAAACCQQGLEFVWNGDHKYPEDYPEVGDEVTVVGAFDSYEEDGYTYYQLISDDVRFE
ncbi:MAG: hypothetical protein PUB98_05385 [Clostridiales bacterium]|nr:hypothetical protein [Clostridiales bacterium]